MKITGLIFIILIFLIAFKITKVFNINLFVIVIVFCLWLAVIYISVHLKNKERETPRPVYLTN